MADSLFPFGRVTDKGYKNSKQIFNLGLKKDRKFTVKKIKLPFSFYKTRMKTHFELSTVSTGGTIIHLLILVFHAKHLGCKWPQSVTNINCKYTLCSHFGVCHMYTCVDARTCTIYCTYLCTSCNHCA